ncbi:malate:quinone oxidoreductase [Alicyclobacillus tengchongensis]|nr:malate dehydrogenase (quinone) [Alicyclobacillus hesperidum]KRW91754.1 malate:quinone oxidoreductase [Alicyclobacillus tengchongensis]
MGTRMEVQNRSDVVLIGAGIMSATLGTLLQQLAPDWTISVFERLDQIAVESSNEWNNAGTGHSALCELNYTVERPDGSIDISKAIHVNEQFLVSRQFWSYLVNQGIIENPRDFIVPVPHMSFVQGDANVAFLRKRFSLLSEHPLFQGMEYSDDPQQLSEWIPLMMKDRSADKPIAATWIGSGTDVNFGALTRLLFSYLEKNGVNIQCNKQVQNLRRTSDGYWNLDVRDTKTGAIEQHSARFVFIGAGGWSLHLLQKSGILEGKGIGGFPVSGLFMVCENPDVVKEHRAKVYGKAPVGAPPMSVPHLDTRVINNREYLLFGPFAGFSPKFLKTGSMLDLLKSVKPHNFTTLLAAGLKNAGLTWYLIKQLMLTKNQRMNELREFVPTARNEDWSLIVAGQRVQVIKSNPRGTLQFGTEVVSASDGSVAALLGASPGASVVVSIMMDVIRKCFPDKLPDWEPKIREMIPSYGEALNENPDLMRSIQAMTAEALGLASAHGSVQA